MTKTQTHWTLGLLLVLALVGAPLVAGSGAPPRQAVGYTSQSRDGSQQLVVSVQPALREGKAVLTVQGLDWHPGFDRMPWAAVEDQVIQWVDNRWYLIDGGILVNTVTHECRTIPFSFTPNYLGSAVSPDGSDIALIVRNPDLNALQVWVCSTADLQPRMVFEAALLPPYRELAGHIRWGSDGSLFFDSQANGKPEIHVIRRGGEPMLLVDSGSMPLPSPDGSYLGYLQADSEGRGRSWVIMDVASEQVIHDSGERGVLSWSSAPGVYSVHMGNRIAVFDAARRQTLRVLEMPGAAAWVSGGETLRVDYLLITGHEVRGSGREDIRIR
jgi:hypothetical protein